MRAWSRMRLAEVADWVGGMTPSMANDRFWSDGDVPWISSRDVLGTELDRTSRLVAQAAIEETPLRLLPAGSVVLVVRSGILRHTLPVAYVPFPTTVNQDIKAATTKPFIDARFLALSLQGQSLELLRNYRKTGTTVESLSVDALLCHEIWVPPLDVQRRIVDLIGVIDTNTAALRAEIAASSTVLSERLEWLLSDHPKVPLGSLLLRIEGGKSPDTAGVPPTDGEPAVLKVSAVSPGRFVPLESKVLLPGTIMDPRWEVRPRDVLMTRANTPERVGAVCLVPRDVQPNLYLSDKTLRLVPDESRVTSEYLMEALQSRAVRRALTANATGTSSSMANISQSKIRDLGISLPSIADQHTIADQLQRTRAAIRALEVECSELANLRSRFLSALLSREVEIPESYDQLFGLQEAV